MKHENQTEKKIKKSSGKPIGAAVTGVLIGAGAMVVGAIVMSKKSNQKKVDKVIDQTKEKIEDYKNDIGEKSQALKDDTKARIDNVTDKVQEIVEVVKEPMVKTKQ
jgi:gas vesicle protein